MKKQLIIAVLLGFAMIVLSMPARAQSPTPTETAEKVPTGEVTGALVNRSKGGAIPENLPIMLHIYDQNYSQLGMLHAQSQPDGSFCFDGVPLNQDLFYVGFVTYRGVSYNSQPVLYDGNTIPGIELPIYETTDDLSQVQVDEMHVLFNFAEDGLEVNEIYLISNLGDRTVTGTITLDDGQPATIELPLPDGADYVFFKPEESERFVKLEDGFVDKAPLVPGERTSRMMVSYLIPYTEEMSYTYFAPLTISNIDFLLPADEQVILSGENLDGPEITTLNNDSIYQAYTHQGLYAGETLSIDMLGQPSVMTSGGSNVSPVKGNGLDLSGAIGIGSGILGLGVIAFGVWRWRKTRDDDTEASQEDDDESASLDEVVAEIAQLDEARGRNEIDEAEYAVLRAALKEKAKELSS